MRIRNHYSLPCAALLLMLAVAGCSNQAAPQRAARHDASQAPSGNKDTGATVPAPPAAENPNIDFDKGPAAPSATAPSQPREKRPADGSVRKLAMRAKAVPSAGAPDNVPRAPSNSQPKSAAAPLLSPGAASTPKPMAAKPKALTAAESPPTEPAAAASEPRAATAPAPAASEPLEAAPPPPDAGSGTPPATVALRAATPPPTDFTIVEVFYGTDRKSVTPAASHPLGKISWGYLTLAAGALTFLLAIVLCFTRRSRVLRWATGLALLATIALAVCMVKIPRNTKPVEADTHLAYGNDRGTLELGTCRVSIPKTHQVGELEGPSVFSLEFNEDPEKHIVLMGVEQHDAKAFYDELRNRVAQSDSREAFVFVHGYNVTFENAARRTAQLAHDLHFDGAPIFYSWPSQGGLLQYTVDEDNVVWTVPHLREFLLGVARESHASRVHLIAHSMGNRALTSALASLATELKQEDLPLFHDVLLTAPDIDAEVFRRDIAPAIVKTANRVTLYASSHDEALVASKKIHGNPRAGESGSNIVVLPGIDTIDVSAIDTSLIGHTYYGDSDTVLTDMAELLHEQKPPKLRDHLHVMAMGALEYWVFLAKKVGLKPTQPEL
jgi:esterase/lipase superfamily enzyme